MTAPPGTNGSNPVPVPPSSSMNCLVTAGPTYEPLDQVRRLTNFSTGRLGTELANFLSAHGHHVTLLIGESATWPGPRRAQRIEVFTTTASLRERLQAVSRTGADAVFHAAAVSDFACGKVWRRLPAGELVEVRAGKIPSEQETLLVELRPTPKLLADLRDWFPQARIVGWKFEVDGDRLSALAAARAQIERNRTDGCVANGPAYGPGFGWVTSDPPEPRHLPDRTALFAELLRWLG